MPATFTLPTIVVIPGQLITATLWNTEFQTIYNNFDPFGMNDYSNTDVQMQTATDPYPGSVTSRPTSLQGELERLRYTINQIKGTTYWYQPANPNMDSVWNNFLTHDHNGVSGHGPKLTNSGLAASAVNHVTITNDATDSGTGIIGGSGDRFAINYDNATITAESNILKVKDLGITNAKINDVATSKLTGTISNAQLAAGAVTDAKVTDVAFGKITGTVTPSDGTVTNAKLTANSVTSDKVVGVLSSQVAGTTTNDSAGAGLLGEYVVSTVSSFTSMGATGTWGNITSISLTAGDWDVFGSTVFDFNAATIFEYGTAVSIYSGNTTTDHVMGNNELWAAPGESHKIGSATVVYRVSVASTTTVYLKSKGDYSGFVPMHLGTIKARRVR